MWSVFYQELFEEEDPLPNWIFDIVGTDILEKLPKLTRNKLKQLIGELQRGKTGARDLIVAERLQNLPDDILDLIIDIFIRRLLNDIEDNEKEGDPWSEIFANLIEKKINPATIREYRPIAIIPVLAKLYSKGLYLWAQPF